MTMINKKWRQNAEPNLINALMRVAGLAVASAVLKKVTDDSFTSKSDVNKTIGNIAAPALSAIAVAGDLFLDNDSLRAVCQGMYAYGIPKTIAVIAPSIGNYMGLSGTSTPIMNGVPPIMNGVPPIMNGVPPIMNGVQPTPQLPAERTFVAVADENSGVNTNGEVDDIAKSMLK